MAVLLALYFLRTLISATFRISGLSWVAAVNLLCGWTLAGWVVALWLVFVYRQIDELEERIMQVPPPLQISGAPCPVRTRNHEVVING